MSTKSGVRSVQYELVREHWNEYVFSDQIVVRVRLILTNVLQDHELGPYRVMTQKLTFVSAPDYLRKAPGSHRQGLCEEGCVRWKTIPLLRDERWNEYSLSDKSQVLKIIFIEDNSSKIMDEYDDTGQPVYVIEGHPLIKVEKIESPSANN